MLTTYAMTEALPIASNPLPILSDRVEGRTPHDERPRDLASVGPPAGPEVAIVDAAGEALPMGVEGEVPPSTPPELPSTLHPPPSTLNPQPLTL